MDAVEKLGLIIGKTTGLFPQEVRLCLEESGVVLDAENYDLSKLVKATFDGLKTSAKFSKKYADLVDLKQSEFQYLDAELMANNEDAFLNLAGSDYVSMGTSVLNLGASIWGSSKASKEASRDRDAQVKAQQTSLEIAQLTASVEREKLALQEKMLTAQSNLGTKGNSNMPLYIGLGIGGVVILGLVVFLVVRKSDN